MDVVTIILLGFGFILFFGYFAEFIFRKVGLPDVLFLIILGFLMGPHAFKLVEPGSLMSVAPFFTTFTLVFLIFDGAFNIHLATLIKELSKSLLLTLFNFIVSAAVITGVMLIGGYSILVSMLTGFILGGVSSSFAIPVLKEMRVSQKVYSLLSLESALTDVFCIVFSLAIIEIFKLGGFGFQNTFSQLASLFAVAGFIGVIAGILWIVLSVKVFKEHNYMITIAYLFLVYVLSEFLQGNGAIAALFFGLVLKNSKQLTSIVQGIVKKESRKNSISKSLNIKKVKKEVKKIKSSVKKVFKKGVQVVSSSEEFFYKQISFLLKTFFFVYIGILINLTDWKALILGLSLSILIMFFRTGSWLITRKMDSASKQLINAVFARGLAAAVLAQIAVSAGFPHAEFISKVVYVVITGTIILSSIRVFIYQRKFPQLTEN